MTSRPKLRPKPSPPPEPLDPFAYLKALRGAIANPAAARRVAVKTGEPRRSKEGVNFARWQAVADWLLAGAFGTDISALVYARLSDSNYF